MFELVSDKKEQDYRTKTTSFRLTEDEYYALTAMAARQHLGKADFIRGLIAGHYMREQQKRKK